MVFSDFKKQLMEEAKKAGFQECEVYFKGIHSFEVLVLEGELSNYETSTLEGIAFRGLYQGKMGYSYTERLQEDSIPVLLEQALENAQIIEEEVFADVYEGKESYGELSLYEPSLAQLTVEEKVNAAKKMEQAALQYHDNVAAIDYCTLRVKEEQVSIANSKGLDVSYQRNNAIGYVCAIAEGNGDVKTGAEYWIGNQWNAFEPEKIGQAAAKNAVEHLGAYSIESGEYHILLHNCVAADLLATFCSAFYGENVQKGFSLLAGRLKEKIASAKVTLRDDGLLEGQTGSVPFDSEGVPCRNKTIIQNGKLEMFLYNRKAAKESGVSATGNGFKPNFKGAVKTACTNFYLMPGGKSLRTLLAQLERGLFITDISGLHAGANEISGDFALSAEGFLVERGQIVRPVEQITIAGNFYTLLKNIEEVGNDLRFNTPSAQGTIGSPSLMVRKLSVSGI